MHIFRLRFVGQTGVVRRFIELIRFENYIRSNLALLLPRVNKKNSKYVLHLWGGFFSRLNGLRALTPPRSRSVPPYQTIFATVTNIVHGKRTKNGSWSRASDVFSRPFKSSAERFLHDNDGITIAGRTVFSVCTYTLDRRRRARR